MEKVRFCEVDSFGVMWHGHYVKYFEIGRLELSKRFALSPDEMRAKGYFAPVIDMGCRFREPARYGHEILIRTTVEPTDRASLTFRYQLVQAPDGPLLAEGFTSHVLLTMDGKMLYMVPEELKQPLEALMTYCNG